MESSSMLVSFATKKFTYVLLFQRHFLEVSCEFEPSFRQSKIWYDINYLRGRTTIKSISYDTHKRCYESVFKTLELNFNKNPSTGSRTFVNSKVRMWIFCRHTGTENGVWTPSRRCTQHLSRVKLFEHYRVILHARDCIFSSAQSWSHQMN